MWVPKNDTVIDTLLSPWASSPFSFEPELSPKSESPFNGKGNWQIDELTAGQGRQEAYLFRGGGTLGILWPVTDGVTDEVMEENCYREATHQKRT